jgi:hypothetical protein
MIISWNFIGNTKKFRDDDVFALSIGKSGRTWLRVLLNKYISLEYGLPFELGDMSKLNKAIPSICYSHEMWRTFSHASVFERMFGKYVIPDSIIFTKKVIVLYRDPRDVVVSLYFQATKRSSQKLRCDMSDFIKDKKYGIYNIIRVLNIWKRRFKNHPGSLWLSYEDLRKDTRGEFLKALEFIGFDGIDPRVVEDTVEFSRFENMKRMEASGAFDKSILQPSDASDPDSFKVRAGKVGGYKSYFKDTDLKYLEDAMKRLDSSFGYR